MAATTLLDKSLSDLRREITDLQQIKTTRDYDMNKLNSLISGSRESLRQTETFQQRILTQLQEFESSLAEINRILRTNSQQKAQLEQQQNSGDDIDIRAKLMALNAEALECRAAAVQLQQDARKALAKASEVEKHVSDELAQQALEQKAKQLEMERDRAAELERRVRAEEERQRSKELQLQQQRQQQEQERHMSMGKNQQPEDGYANWIVREFMRDDRCPPCIVRTSPDTPSIALEITFLAIAETEHLLDAHEELIGTPLKIKFDSTRNAQQFILLAVPYIVKRSAHRENVIKIRQANGLWISVDTNESLFDAHKDKRFVECQLDRSAACAVVSRLKRDIILIENRTANRFSSSADARFTMQWSAHTCQTDFRIDACLQPVDLPTFTQFCEQHAHESQGLIAVGPIIEFNFDDGQLLKPIQITLPILVQAKKKPTAPKQPPPPPPPPLITQSGVPQQPPEISTSQPSPLDQIQQQQQSIFKSVLGEDSSNERLVLLYSGVNENIWHVDSNVRLIDSKTRDLITTDLQTLHGRMIIARCDKQSMSIKQLQTTIALLDRSLIQRSVLLLLRRRLSNPKEICLVCCSTQRSDTIENELIQENYTNDDEQAKELILQEGQLLELRFRGNVLPIGTHRQPCPFAFNTYFPFYFEANVNEIDKYSQHFSPYYYGFLQIFSKQKVLRTVNKEIDKKKLQQPPPQETKQEWYETDECLAELLVRLPKVREEIRSPVAKTSTNFVGEGILTATLFRDIAVSLIGDEWRWLARRLGITRIRLEAIERDYQEEAPYYMLIAWYKRVPRSADKILLLINAMMNINRWDLAQDLQTMKDDHRNERRSISNGDQTDYRALFNRICQRDECVRFWKQIARELMLNNDDIQQIEQQYSSAHERCLRILEHWAKHDARADPQDLIRIIRSLGFKFLARELESMT